MMDCHDPIAVLDELDHALDAALATYAAFDCSELEDMKARVDQTRAALAAIAAPEKKAAAAR